MTIQDLGALGEFLGSIAVLATLVYLALQTRQNTAAIAMIPLAGALGFSALLGSILGALLYARSQAPKRVRLRHASGADWDSRPGARRAAL